MTLETPIRGDILPKRDDAIYGTSWWKRLGSRWSIIPKGSAQCEHLTRRMGKQKAIVAIARKLLVAVWHILTKQQADTHAQAQAVARKLMNWISHQGVIPGQHRDRLLLLYQHLDELGLSEELEEIDYYGTTYRLSVRQQLLREAQKRRSP